MPDHPTPCSTKKHSHGDVPLVMSGTGIVADQSTLYSEQAARATNLRFAKGWELMHKFIEG
jgi:2,3-bisphosphoglycerate-independent phosphoglycerate mutase